MSAPRPMPFWADDWLTSETVDAMTAQEERAYFRLLMRCWIGRGCSLPNDERQLAAWGRWNDGNANGNANGIAIGTLSTIVRAQFVTHPDMPDRLTNLKALALYQDAMVKYAKKAESGRKGARSRWRKNTAVNSNANGNANGIANGNAIGYPIASPSYSYSYKEDINARARDPRSTEQESHYEAADALRHAILRTKPDHRCATSYECNYRAAWASDLLRLHDEGRGPSWERIIAVCRWLPTSDFWASKVLGAVDLCRNWERLEAAMREPAPAVAAAARQERETRDAAERERKRSAQKLAELNAAAERAVGPPPELGAIIAQLARAKAAPTGES